MINRFSDGYYLFSRVQRSLRRRRRRGRRRNDFCTNLQPSPKLNERKAFFGLFFKGFPITRVRGAEPSVIMRYDTKNKQLK